MQGFTGEPPILAISQTVLDVRFAGTYYQENPLIPFLVVPSNWGLFLLKDIVIIDMKDEVF